MGEEEGAIVCNPAERTLTGISMDGKLVNLAGVTEVRAGGKEDEHFIIAIFNDPNELEPTAYAKISPQQLAQWIFKIIHAGIGSASSR